MQPTVKIKLLLTLKIIVTAIFITAVSISLINWHIISSANQYIYEDLNDIPPQQTALLLGAKVYENGRLSSIVQDRALTAIDLYKNNKVKKILISGDHGTAKYDEVNTIKNFLLEKGIPKKDIFMDHAGFDTYDSMYRARDIFEVDSMIVVTQEFHLARSVYIARSLGIGAYGLIADRQPYLNMWQNHTREFLARGKAFIDVTFTAKPKFLGEKIPITGDSLVSWD